MHGRLGRVVGGLARVYNSRAQAFAILKRDPHATPVLDVLTYYVDLMCWFLEGNRPVEVVARGQHGIFKEAGYGAHDVTWAIVTFADGAVVNFGVSYALPARYPTLGQSDRVELLGSEGTMIIDDDHWIICSIRTKAFRTPMCRTTPSTWRSSAATPRATGRSAISGDRSATRRAPGSNSLVTGHPTVHTTPEQARINLETTLAIERAVRPASRCGCRSDRLTPSRLFELQILRLDHLAISLERVGDVALANSAGELVCRLDALRRSPFSTSRSVLGRSPTPGGAAR